MDQEQSCRSEKRRDEVGKILLKHMEDNPKELVHNFLDCYADVRNSLDVCLSVIKEVKKAIQDGHVVITDPELERHFRKIFF
jgi:hypothetical protein